MDWDRLESDATAMLQSLLRYGVSVDTESIFGLAFEKNHSWRVAPDGLLYAYRALDLLDLLELVDKPDGVNRRISEKGRRELAFLEGKTLHVDRSSPTIAAWADLEELASHSETPVTSENSFSRLWVSRWRQFESIDIRFHPRLTILTGANGSGKTTLLNILAPHFSWHAQLVSSGVTSMSGPSHEMTASGVGELVYSNGARTAIAEPVALAVQVSSLQMPTQQAVPGIFISSHRSISSYQPLQSLPARFSAANVILGQFAAEVQTRYSGGMSQFPPLYRMKEALVSAAMYGYGNAALVPNDDAREIWEGFQSVLAQFLPEGLEFRKLLVEDGNILLETASSRFPLEAVSGGLSAMLELAWQIFLRAKDSLAFTVCIDEPENHLHPELQRTIVPGLLSAFPHVTFVIATHSPFVVTAAVDCSVYALTNTRSGAISSRLVRNVNASWTSDQTLMSVLGLDTPLPLWAENRLSDALSQLPADPTTTELRQLRERLMEAGLGDQFPAALAALSKD